MPRSPARYTSQKTSDELLCWVSTSQLVYITAERIHFLLVLGTWSMEKAVDRSISHWSNILLEMCCYPSFLLLWLNKFRQREKRCLQTFSHNSMTTKWFVNCLNQYIRWKSLICNVKRIANFNNSMKPQEWKWRKLQDVVSVSMRTYRLHHLMNNLVIGWAVNKCWQGWTLFKTSIVAILIRQILLW